jgi:hypothetical protein
MTTGTSGGTASEDYPGNSPVGHKPSLPCFERCSHAHHVHACCGRNTATKRPEEDKMQIIKTVQVDGLGDGASAYAYVGKRGANAGADMVSFKLTVTDLVEHPELVELFADRRVSFALTLDDAAKVAKASPDAAHVLATAGIKPAPKRTRKAA